MWTCRKGCGECCISHGMPPFFVRRYIKDAVVPTEIIEDGVFLVPKTSDGLCFLLDRNTKKCTKYNKRPPICHWFGRTPNMRCPYITRDGLKRTEAETRLIHTQQLNTADYAAAYKRFEDEKRAFWIR